MRQFLAFSEGRAAECGLTPQQHQALLAIRGATEEQAVTVGFIAERLILKPHSATGLVDRLEALELVERRPAPDDRRRALIVLTPKALALLEAAVDDAPRGDHPAAPDADDAAGAGRRRRLSGLVIYIVVRYKITGHRPTDISDIGDAGRGLMRILLVALESIGLVLGSLALAGLLNGALWSAFRRVNHPDWAWIVLVLPVAALLAMGEPHSGFLRLALDLRGDAGGAFWFEGRAWRSRWRIEHRAPIRPDGQRFRGRMRS